MRISLHFVALALALSFISPSISASGNLEIYRPLFDAFDSSEPKENENIQLSMVKLSLEPSENEFAILAYSSWVGQSGEFALYQFAVGPEKKIRNVKRIKKFEAGGNHLLWKDKRKTFLQAHDEVYELTSAGPVLHKQGPRKRKQIERTTLALYCTHDPKGKCKITVMD